MADIQAESSFFLGCPVWSCPQWRGTVYAHRAKRERWLADYSRSFNTVEGNSTFYAIPSTDTFQRWANETIDGFRFALKFPREITHELKLVNCDHVLNHFLDGLEILHAADRLGPSFLQLAPSFDPSMLGRLVKFLEQLPTGFPYAVEVRHPLFFEGSIETELNDVLRQLNIDRVIFDSRPLYSQPPSDEFEERSQTRKPKVPIRTSVTGGTPFLRLVGRNDLNTVQKWTDEWADQIVQWLESGMKPFVFTHTPDDRWAPEFALRIQNAVAKRMQAPKQRGFKYESAKQLKLF